VVVTVNGERHELAPGATVATVVQALNVAPRGVAVALDGEVVARSQWAHAPLHEGSLVEIVAAIQGG
jgi:sulfur carrier protein